MPFQKGMKPLNAQDLTDRRFNMLYVESFAGKKGNQYAWNCVCDCGKRKVVTSHYLTSGKTKSCGCLRHKSNMEDLAGYETEDLIVLSFYGKQNGRTFWNYKCKHCGKINKGSATNIKRGGSTCKCIHGKRISEARRKEGRNTPIYGKWLGMKCRCFNPNDSHYKDYGGRGITICPEWLNFDNFYKWSMDNGYKNGYSIERNDVNGNYCPENCCWIPVEDQPKNKRNTIYIEINGEKKRLKEWCEIYNANYKIVHQRIFRYGMEPLEALTIQGKRGK